MHSQKARYNISFKEVSGESKLVTPEITAAWKETSLHTILSRYELKDSYNADEFGLFYQGLPKKTLHLKGERCSGGKYSKVRLTGMTTASATGEKLPMFVIGKSVKPRCFKHVKSLPCRYRAQPKSWMSSFLFHEWVKELDSKFEKENRRIVIVGNCPAHPIVDGLKAIEVVFLPPNTTSKTQPMDQGVIRSLKVKYRRKIIKPLIRAVDIKKKLPQTSILDAMQLLQSAWSEISELTIKNCFRKSGISEKSAEQAINKEDDPFKDITADLEENITELGERLPEEAPEALNVTDILDADAELSTNGEKPSDAEIIAEIRGEVPDDEDETDIDFVIDDPKVHPTEKEIEKAIALCFAKMERF